MSSLDEGNIRAPALTAANLLLYTGITGLNAKMAQNTAVITQNIRVQTRLQANQELFIKSIGEMISTLSGVDESMGKNFRQMVIDVGKISTEAINEILEPITEGLGSKQVEKGAKSMTNMMAATAKASVYAWVMEQFMELFTSLMFILTPFVPMITILAAIIKTFLAPAVRDLTAAFRPLYAGMLTWRKMVAGFVVATDAATTAGERMNIILGWFGTSLEKIGTYWGETGQIIMDGLAGQLEILGDIMGAVTISAASLGNSLSLGGGEGGGGGNGGGGFDWSSLIPSFAGGGYTGNYQGLANVHSDEYIFTGNEMRSGGTGMYVQQIYTNELLSVIVRQNERTERRARFRI